VFPIWDSVTGTLRTRADQHAEERRQAIAQAADKARHTRDLLARHGIACPTITGAGTGTFEFETASGVYTELQCGSCVKPAPHPPASRGPPSPPLAGRGLG